MSFSFFGSVEITAFSDRYEEFQKLNTEILGVSVDSVVSVFSAICMKIFMSTSL